MELDERMEKIGLIALNDVQEELTPSEYLAQDHEKTIEEQWKEYFLSEGA